MRRPPRRRASGHARDGDPIDVLQRRLQLAQRAVSRSPRRQPLEDRLADRLMPSAGRTASRQIPVFRVEGGRFRRPGHLAKRDCRIGRADDERWPRGARPRHRTVVGELGDGPHPDEAPVGEDPDPVAYALDLIEQVAGQENGRAPLADEPPEQLQDLGDTDRVDRGRRLVQDEDVRVLDECVGDAEALEHAPRVGVRPGCRRAPPGPPARERRRCAPRRRGRPAR